MNTQSNVTDFLCMACIFVVLNNYKIIHYEKDKNESVYSKCKVRQFNLYMC